MTGKGIDRTKPALSRDIICYGQFESERVRSYGSHTLAKRSCS